MVVSPINMVAVEYTLSMVFISRPENLAITQKYASLACDIIIEPAPMASTQSSLPFSVSNPRAGKSGSMMEDAVIIATVDEPWAVFKTEVNKKGKKIPMLPRATAWLKCSPILAAVRIAPKAPPIPMITKIPPAFSVVSCNSLLSSLFCHPRLQLNASTTPVNSAITGSPRVSRNVSQPG